MAARRICLTFDPARAPRFLEHPEELPPADVVELRADLLPAEALASGRWRAFARRAGRECVFTWRSPDEGGGGGPRPAGVRGEALDAGFRWVDVEAAELAAGGAGEAPADRRWVSAHPAATEWTPRDLAAWFSAVRAHPAALHKLVVRAASFAQARAALDLAAEARGDTPHTVFAQGPEGHLTRVLGGLRGNALTFAAAGDDAATAAGQPGFDRLVNTYRFRDLDAGARVYGVAGAAALRSLSPAMHNACFAAEGIAAVYLPLPTPELAPVLAWMREGGAAGLSVTMPFKAEASAAAEVRSPRAERVGAANTLWLEEGRIHADNTDVLAAEALLGALGGERVAVLGAGGAAAAVVWAARGLGREVVIVNRTAGRAESLARSAGARLASGIAHALRDCDVAVNTLPPGAEPGYAALAGLDWGGAALLDLTYDAAGTVWERIARERGLPYVGGRRFLAEQAVEQFARWTGRRVPAARFLEAIDA